MGIYETGKTKPPGTGEAAGAVRRTSAPGAGGGGGQAGMLPGEARPQPGELGEMWRWREAPPAPSRPERSRAPTPSAGRTPPGAAVSAAPMGRAAEPGGFRSRVIFCRPSVLPSCRLSPHPRLPGRFGSGSGGAAPTAPTGTPHRPARRRGVCGGGRRLPDDASPAPPAAPPRPPPAPLPLPSLFVLVTNLL